jgi:AcrR family transcriptional regulator
MMDAARQLLIERGNGNFTLTEVSKLGRVSIGSIYCRFTSKDDLLLAVQTQFSEELDIEQQQIISRAADQAHDLAGLMGLMVMELAELLRRRAPLMRPLMQCANSDPDIAAIGKAYHGRLHDRMKRELLKYRDEIRHHEPERAAGSIINIGYAAMARYLGFGSATIAAGEGDWEDLKRDLAAMSAAFLLNPPVVPPVGGAMSRQAANLSNA